MTAQSRRFGGAVPAPATKEEPAAAAFVAAAPGKRLLPWHQDIPADAKAYVNTAQPIRLMRQVDWLAHETGRTKREIIEDAIREHMRRELTRLGVDPEI